MSQNPKELYSFSIIKGLLAAISFVGFLSITAGLTFPALNALGYEIIKTDVRNDLEVASEKSQGMNSQLEVCERLRVDDIQVHVSQTLQNRQARLTELTHSIHRYEHVSLAARLQLAIEGFKLTLRQAVYNATGTYAELPALDKLIPTSFVQIPGVDNPSTEYSAFLNRVFTSLISVAESFSPENAQKLSEAIARNVDQNNTLDTHHHIFYQTSSDASHEISNIVRNVIDNPSQLNPEELLSAMFSYLEYHPLLHSYESMLADTDVQDAILSLRNEAVLGKDLTWFENTVFFGPYRSIPIDMRSPGLVLVFQADNEGESEYAAWEYTDDIFLYSQAVKAQDEGEFFLTIPISRNSYFLRDRLIKLAESIEFGTKLQ